jgi:hypothetical protein
MAGDCNHIMHCRLHFGRYYNNADLHTALSPRDAAYHKSLLVIKHCPVVQEAD